MLCGLFVGDTSQKRAGGQNISIGDRLFAVVFRTFANTSIDNALFHMSAIVTREGYRVRTPSRNKPSDFHRDERLIDVLRDCLRRTCPAVRKIKTMVLVDSSGFASTPTQVYLDNDRGDKVVRIVNTWMKAHVSCGATTGLICDVIVTPHEGKIDNSDERLFTADVNFFDRLVTAGCNLWPVKYASADNAYLRQEPSGL